MAGELHFHAFGQEPFASALTAPSEDGAAAFGAHPGAETVLLFPGPFRSLQGAFHGKNGLARNGSAYSRRGGKFVNVPRGSGGLPPARLELEIP